MAKSLKAHVSGRLYALEPEISVGVFGGLPADLLQTYRANVKKDAEAAGKRFDEAAAKAKVQATRHLTMVPLAAASTIFARVARTYDVSVLAQSSDGIYHMGDVFIEAALFHSGRPVIIAPLKGHSQFAADRVTIAWDGSLHAARAVGASMPILALAKKIDILTMGEDSKEPEVHAADLVRHLERHGFDVSHKRRNGDDIPKTILKETEKTSASLLVMGAYGHSRLREFVFGGVTRFMLANATVPVLMMH
ncbi:MAG: universal stress protein [Xanthobacteraceae bacterium]